MAVRQIRRSFATPFIVTLASSAAIACGPKPLPKHDHVNPPSPHSNPPAPDSQPTGTTETPPPTIPASPAPPAPPEAVKEPAKYEQRWTVMKFKGKEECSVMVDVQCPKAEPGKPVATCNPPPPIKYACPADFKVGDTLEIVQRVGATDCVVEGSPSRNVPCPER